MNDVSLTPEPGEQQLIEEYADAELALAVFDSRHMKTLTPKEEFQRFALRHAALKAKLDLASLLERQNKMEEFE